MLRSLHMCTHHTICNMFDWTAIDVAPPPSPSPKETKSNFTNHWHLEYLTKERNMYSKRVRRNALSHSIRVTGTTDSERCFVRVRQFYYFHVHSKLIVDGHQNLIINLANERATTSSWEKVRAPGIDVDDVACDEFDFCLTLLDRRELINRA